MCLRATRDDLATFYLPNLLGFEPCQLRCHGIKSTTATGKNKNRPKWSVCVFGGSGWIRTTSGLSQQIYSLPRLSNSGARPELCRGFASAKTDGAGSGTRTRTSSLEGLRTSPCTMPAINPRANRLYTNLYQNQVEIVSNSQISSRIYVIVLGKQTMNCGLS